MKFPRFLFFSLILFIVSYHTKAQTARSVTVLDSIYTEDFDAFGTSCPGASTLVAPLEVNYGVATLTELEANDGNNPCDDDAASYAFHYGTDGETDRAIGGKAVFGSDLEIIYYIQNNTGQTVYDVGVFYTGEQWYSGESFDNLLLDLSIGNGTSLATISYTDVDGDFSDLNDCPGLLGCSGPGGTSDGNIGANRTTNIESMINIPGGVDDGEFVAFRWIFTTTNLLAQSDDLAIDDLNFILFDDDNTTWYMLSGDNDPRAADSWTRWSTDLPSTLLPSCDGFGVCSDADVSFVINASQDLLYDIEFTGDDVYVNVSGAPEFDGQDVIMSGDNAVLQSSVDMAFGFGDLILSGANSDFDISGNLAFTSGEFVQSGANSETDIVGNVSLTSGRFIQGGDNSTMNITGNVLYTSGWFQVNGDDSDLDVSGDVDFTTGMFSSNANDANFEIGGDINLSSGIIQFTGENSVLDVLGEMNATDGPGVILTGDSSAYIFRGALDVEAGGSIFLSGNASTLDFKEVVNLESTDLNVSGNNPSVYFRKALSVSDDIFEASNSDWASTNGIFSFENSVAFLDAVGTLEISGDSNLVSIATTFETLGDITISGDTNDISVVGISTITADDFVVSGNANTLDFQANVNGSTTDFGFSGNADTLLVGGDFSLTSGNISIAGTNQYDSLIGDLSFTNGDLLLTGSGHRLFVNGAVSSSNASVLSFNGSNQIVDFNSTLSFTNGGTFTVPGSSCDIDVESTSVITNTGFTLAGNNSNLTFGDSFTGTTGIWTIAGDDVVVTFDGTSVLGTGDVTLSGSNGKFVVEDNASLKLDYYVGQAGFESDFTGTVTVKNNATLFYNRYDDSSTDALALDSCYNGSTIEFDNLEADGVATEQNIPTANYYNLIIRGDAFDESDKDILYSGAITIRNNFTYERSIDGVTISDPVTFTGNPGVISTPNYSASGIFEEIIIANGANITFGSLFNNAKYQDRFEHNNILTIEAGGTLSLLADQTLRLTTTSLFSHNGVLNVPTDASLIIANGKTVSGTGLTNITRAQSATPSASVFNHWSSPVSSASIGSGEEVDGVSNYRYDNGEDDNADFQKLYAPQSMPVGKGYSALGNLSSTFVANGPSEINFGDITYTASEQEDGDSDDENYYLVGNPYASGLSVYDFLLANTHATVGLGNVKGTIYLFSQVNTFGNYSRTADNIAVNMTGISDLGPAATGNSTVTSSNDYTIASGQGFFVIDASPITTGIEIDFSESMQNGINNDFKSSRKASEKIKSRYWLTINNQTNYNSTLVAFISDATLGFDNFYDAPKVPSDVALDIWSYIKNDRYEIQGLPENILATQRIPLGVTVPSIGLFDINIAATDGVDDEPIILLDVKEGVYHDLKNGVYQFSSDAKGQILNRFYLLVQGEGQPVSIDDLNADAKNNNCVDNLSAKSLRQAFVEQELKRVEVYTLTGQIQFGWNTGGFSTLEFEQIDRASIFKIQMKNGKVCTQKVLR
jgi:hypothetical protein